VTSLVTIGIPTYNRPSLLSRALAAVERQNYTNLEVLVSDNATPGDASAKAVERYRTRIPGLIYIRQPSTLQPVEHFMYLLGQAQGRYFMWLADDDEISPNYVASLVKLLEGDPSASSAAGQWLLMTDESKGRVMQTSSYPQGSALARVLQYIWGSNDAFFYGLHRTDLLRQASFRGYWRPNRDVSLNWAYVFLLDMVIRGRVLLVPDSSVEFINHDYTEKAYKRRRGALARTFAFLIRRMNVHYLYWEKCAQLLGPASLLLVVPTSVLSLLREGGVMLWRGGVRASG
jgi:glycosyltransferase involved in cell wall biosynthesis